MTRSPYPITRAELQSRCPLVTVEVSDHGLVGKLNGETVVDVRGKSIDGGMMKRFQAAYEKARAAGLLKEKA